MFGVSVGELIMVVIIFIIFVPPERVPGVISNIWKGLSSLKQGITSITNELSALGNFNEADDLDLEELNKLLDDANRAQNYDHDSKTSGKNRGSRTNEEN